MQFLNKDNIMSDNNETARFLQRLNEQANENYHNNNSYYNMRESQQILEEAQRHNENAIKSVEKGKNLVKKEQILSKQEMQKNITQSSEAVKNIYPYHIKNEIYKRVIDEVFSHLTDEEKNKYTQMFADIYKEKLNDDVLYIEVYTKKRKTSNF